MPDREKVVNALANCVTVFGMRDCSECPYKDSDDCENNLMFDALALLKEQIEDFHCKGCDNYNFVRCRACHIDDAITYLDEAPTVGGWISVKDRLPSEYGNYIAFCEGEVMECTYAPPKKGMIPGWSTCDAHGVHFFGEKSVTHWMKMPEPPKEG